MGGKICYDTKCIKCGRDFGKEWIISPHRIVENNKTIWVCGSCYSKHRYKNGETNSNLKKALRDCRTGNLKDPNIIFGYNCEDLTSILLGVKRLSVEYDKYTRLPLDHSIHPVFGVLQTKGRHFNIDIGLSGGWIFGALERDWNKDFDNMIALCVSKNNKNTERIYIIPKKEIKGRYSISIVESPSKGGEPWYEQYRVKDQEILQKANEIWKEIIGE